MALEYNKVVEQVQRMARALTYRMQELSERANLVYEQFQQMPDNDVIRDRIRLARSRDAGYRGAAPLDTNLERINAVYECPTPPPKATIIAADGSQIYPNPHGGVFYYLTNVGVFSYFHGEDRLADQYSEPRLFYADSDIRDDAEQLVKNAAVNARRDVFEMKLLARQVWEYHHEGRPILALSDGSLFFWLDKDVPNARQLESDYHGAFVRIHDTDAEMRQAYNSGAYLAGYIDRPTSRFVISLLHLLSIPEEDVRKAVLEKPGDYEGLEDKWLFQHLLQPGQRSALMVQQSPRNKEYQELGKSYEIVFFYVNIGSAGHPHLARVEIPMWVARLPQAVNEVHALIIEQCRLQGRYPYALTRADEVAVVRGAEKTALDELIRTELLRNQQFVEDTPKALSKQQTRASRRSFGQTPPFSSNRRL